MNPDQRLDDNEQHDEGDEGDYDKIMSGMVITESVVASSKSLLDPAPKTRGVGLAVCKPQTFGAGPTFEPFEQQVNQPTTAAFTNFLNGMLNQQPQPRALEPEPIYYEKYSSFNSSCPPQQLLESISTALKERSNVDYEPDLQKNKIKGVAYESNGRCTFKVRLYKGKKEGDVLCEFQRRSGCVVCFNKMYRRTLASSHVRCHLTEKVEKNSGSWLQDFDVMQADADPTVKLDTATATNLMSMAGCEVIDVQREGAQALASVAKHPVNQEKLVEMQDSVVKLLQKLLGSIDTELCRSGCVLLAHMASQDSIRSSLIENCLADMGNVLGAFQSFETVDSKRQVIQTLGKFMQSSQKDIVNHPAVENVKNALKTVYAQERQNYDEVELQNVYVHLANACA